MKPTYTESDLEQILKQLEWPVYIAWGLLLIAIHREARIATQTEIEFAEKFIDEEITNMADEWVTAVTNGNSMTAMLILKDMSDE